MPLHFTTTALARTYTNNFRQKAHGHFLADDTSGFVGRYLYGCTDSLAENYDATSNFNDGSCSYTVKVPVAAFSVPAVTSITPTLIPLAGEHMHHALCMACVVSPGF